MKKLNRTEHKLTFTLRFSELGFRANKRERDELHVSEREQESKRRASLFREGTREMRGVHESEIGFQRRREWGYAYMRLKFQEILLRKQRRFVTAGEAAGVMRSGSGYSSTATIYLSLKTFFLVVYVRFNFKACIYVHVTWEFLFILCMQYFI
jgi:hypothetical protein